MAIAGIGCAGTASESIDTPDSGAPVLPGHADAGPHDAGTHDAGVPDAGTTDTGAPDAGTPDSGSVSPPDAGPTFFTLSLIVSAGGHVTLPDNTTCSDATCTQTFAAGTSIQLQVVPDPGFTFSGWTLDGNCGTQITLSYSMGCGASFAKTMPVDLSAVQVFDSPLDIASWSETAQITEIDWSAVTGNDGIYVNFTKRDGADRWPDVPFGTEGGSLEYTLWIIIEVPVGSGSWFTSGPLEYWNDPSEVLRQGGGPTNVALNWFYDGRWGALQGQQPAPGQLVGIFVSAGNARNITDHSGSIVLERSNVAWIPFPPDTGAVYNF